MSDQIDLHDLSPLEREFILAYRKLSPAEQATLCARAEAEGLRVLVELLTNAQATRH